MIFLFLFVSQVFAATVTGKVTKVLDGDTVDILVADALPTRIRLAQIDAPEKSQEFGLEARQTLSDLVLGKEVSVDFEKRDGYGRVIGLVKLNGVDVNLLMVQVGLAWVYLEFSHNQEYVEAEDSAKEKKLGLWKSESPTAPWTYRQMKKRK